MEEWRDIIEYEGLYQISNKGRVKSLGNNKNRKEKILSLKPINGYIRVFLYKNGKPKPYSVHRLVAIAFIPNPNNYPEVNHIDEDKTNNIVENLEWCDKKYNMNYGTRNNRAGKKISENRKGKYLYDKNPKATKVKCITTGEVFNCIKEASKKYNVIYQSISKCCRGERNYAGKHPVTKEKLVWEYVE